MSLMNNVICYLQSPGCTVDVVADTICAIRADDRSARGVTMSKTDVIFNCMSTLWTIKFLLSAWQ